MTTKKKTTIKKTTTKKPVEKKATTTKKEVVVEVKKTNKEPIVYYGINKEKVVFIKDIKGQNEPLLKEVHLVGRTEVVTPDLFNKRIEEAN